ncbi:4'-phosphopantetheinyl transferase family protein [Arenimonas sp.]|uniref:4'-phosphopantetheinyl transferase family protein n=1 Tax=Arenimonas sp. TaxID=1872635 RepID=UPI0039E382B5
MLADELRLWWCPHEDSRPSARRARVDRLLRALLAPLLGLAQQDLSFAREAKGRPFLRHPNAPDFNLTDTAGGSAVAICMRGRVGVDIERLDRVPPVVRLARRWYSPEEATALAALSAEQRAPAFLRLWTAKEASCKATGTGIFGYLPRWRFDAHEEQPQLLALPDDAGTLSHWQHRRITMPGNQHTVVLALQDAPSLRLNCFVLAQSER